MGYIKNIQDILEKSRAEAERKYGPQEKGDVAGENVIPERCMTALANSLSMQNSAINNMLARDDELKNIYDGYGATIGGPTIYKQKPPMEIVVRRERGKIKEVTALCYFTFGDTVNFDLLHPTGKFKITGFDRRVYNAVGTMWNIGQQTFSLSELFGVMNGYKKAHPTENQLEMIWRSIYKMEQVVVYIDLTDEFKANMIRDKQPLIDAGILKNNRDNVKRIEIKDRMLHVQGSIITSVQGKTTKKIHLVNEPVLCAYNRSKQSIISVPIAFVRCYTANATEKAIAFQDYLIIRVLSYARGIMKENKVRYDSIYQFSGIDKPEGRNDRARDRRIIKAIMQEWVDKGLIESFEEIKSGHCCVGFRFDVKEKLNALQSDGDHGS